MVKRPRHPTSQVTPVNRTSSRSAFTITEWTAYAQPFTTQPWRFLWWVDNAAHRLLPPRLARRLFGRLCDHLDRKMWT